MAEAVVDALEVVEVTHRDGEGRAVASRAQHLDCEQFSDVATRAQSGHGIGGGDALEHRVLVAELGLEPSQDADGSRDARAARRDGTASGSCRSRPRAAAVPCDPDRAEPSGRRTAHPDPRIASGARASNFSPSRPGISRSQTIASTFSDEQHAQADEAVRSLRRCVKRRGALQHARESRRAQKPSRR